MLNLLSKHLKNIMNLNMVKNFCRVRISIITFYIILFWQTLLFESLVSLNETFKT
jgi:hypothetical protein